MHIAALEVTNWLRFRGRHMVRLQPTTYGLTAAWDGNPRRSNWGGKSSTIEAVWFALTGRHRKRTEDEWLTTGEREGGVRLILNTDAVAISVERMRTRGKSTKLTVRVNGPHDELTFLGDEAQAEIERRIGLGPDDFEKGPYLAQGRMSRFITDDPGERMKTVVAWFRLALLEEAAQSVGAQLVKAQDDIAATEAERRAAREAAEHVAKNCGVVALDQQLVDEAFTLSIAAAEAGIANAKGVVALFEGEAAKHATIARDYEEADRYRLLVEAGKALRRVVDAREAELSQVDAPAAKSALEGAQGALGRATAEVEAKRRLARGEFDGTCPVAGIACPAKAEINAATKRNTDLLLDATTTYNKIAHNKQERELEHYRIEKLARQQELDRQKLDAMRAEALRLKPAAMRVEKLDEVDNSTAAVDLEKARAHLGSLEGLRYNLVASRDLVAAQETAMAKAGVRLEALRKRAELLREAQLILGRQGAQRRIAEGHLAEIEASANHALGTCGIDLALRVSWARETKGLAKACDACGAPYPKTATQKVCVRCGAPRGQHFESKLEVEPSAESGAAKNLGGIVFQLAAADWLCRDRAAAWRVALVDEPLEALDAEHRALLAGHLPMLLRHFGFVQSIVVAHDASAMAGMPATIHVQAGPGGSKFEGEEENADDRAGGVGNAGAVAPAGGPAKGKALRSARGVRKGVSAEEPRDPGHGDDADDRVGGVPDADGGGARGHAPQRPADQAPRRRRSNRPRPQ